MTNRSLDYRNFVAFIWHALFLAFAAIFIDVNTVLSSLILNIGGSSIHVGILTSLSVGLPMITQLFFAAFLTNQRQKKPFLLIGIYLRVISLAGMGYTLSIADTISFNQLLWFVFFWIALFSSSGAFAGVSYTDLLGKIFIGTQRERFLVFKQFITATAMLMAAVVARQLVVAFPYPQNYTIMFLIASGLLFIATLGFIMIREDAVEKTNTPPISETLKSIPRLLKTDRNLLSYILLINLVSLGITIIPFYIAYSKSLFGLNADQTGRLLLLQFIGMIVSTFIWKVISNKYRFKGVAYGGVILGAIIPPIAVALSGWGFQWYQWIFIITGFFSSAQAICLQGILLEITTNQNRAMMTGISGTLSLTAVVFPLVAGVLINLVGFRIVILAVSPLMLIALIFLRRIVCHKPDSEIQNIRSVFNDA